MAIRIISISIFLSFVILCTLYKVGNNQNKEDEEITYQDFEDSKAFRSCGNECYKCEISQKCWEVLNHMEV
ncbi:hypothetical protein [Clostridium sp. OS1-26]|uniref:hypothetical protein n=1 Tax=Clostridium sp. OS1-26 TaxID=3070681 RepID=UPI0027DEC930|nr:hypothetical protein [Clostridium sp. OS1-26]WML34820.1 hypothetical protein RCG18_26810 [Clostridium sp. OS1-26]